MGLGSVVEVIGGSGVIVSGLGLSGLGSNVLVSGIAVGLFSRLGSGVVVCEVGFLDWVVFVTEPLFCLAHVHKTIYYHGR